MLCQLHNTTAAAPMPTTTAANHAMSPFGPCPAPLPVVFCAGAAVVVLAAVEFPELSATVGGVVGVTGAVRLARFCMRRASQMERVTTFAAGGERMLVLREEKERRRRRRRRRKPTLQIIRTATLLNAGVRFSVHLGRPPALARVIRLDAAHHRRSCLYARLRARGDVLGHLLRRHGGDHACCGGPDGEEEGEVEAHLWFCSSEPSGCNVSRLLSRNGSRCHNSQRKIPQ
jgi:hypothetical protein